LWNWGSGSGLRGRRVAKGPVEDGGNARKQKQNGHSFPGTTGRSDTNLVALSGGATNEKARTGVTRGGEIGEGPHLPWPPPQKERLMQRCLCVLNDGKSSEAVSESVTAVRELVLVLVPNCILKEKKNETSQKTRKDRRRRIAKDGLANF